MAEQRPIFIMRQEGVPSCQTEAAVAGVVQALEDEGAIADFEVRDLGLWREPGWKTTNVPHQSVDFYVNRGWIISSNRVRFSLVAVLEALRQDPYRDWDDRYSVLLIMKDPSATEDTATISSATAPGVGTVVLIPRCADCSVVELETQLTAEVARQIRIGLALGRVRHKEDSDPLSNATSQVLEFLYFGLHGRCGRRRVRRPGRPVSPRPSAPPPAARSSGSAAR
jgi:hypothetical protein